MWLFWWVTSKKKQSNWAKLSQPLSEVFSVLQASARSCRAHGEEKAFSDSTRVSYPGAGSQSPSRGYKVPWLDNLHWCGGLFFQGACGRLQRRVVSWNYVQTPCHCTSIHSLQHSGSKTSRVSWREEIRGSCEAVEKNFFFKKELKTWHNIKCEMWS